MFMSPCCPWVPSAVCASILKSLRLNSLFGKVIIDQLVQYSATKAAASTTPGLGVVFARHALPAPPGGVPAVASNALAAVAYALTDRLPMTTPFALWVAATQYHIVLPLLASSPVGVVRGTCMFIILCVLPLNLR